MKAEELKRELIRKASETAMTLYPYLEELFSMWREYKRTRAEEKNPEKVLLLKVYRQGEHCYPPCVCHEWQKVKVILAPTMSGVLLHVLWARDFEDDDRAPLEGKVAEDAASEMN